MKCKLHTDSFDTNGKVYTILGYNKYMPSTRISLELEESDGLSFFITLSENEVEFLDEG